VTQFVQHVVDALSVGSTYALLALSLTLVFSVMRLINFAFGIMLVWAGYAAIVMVDAGVPFAVMVPLCVVFSILLSVAVGLVAFRPFIGAPPITLLITSFGVLLVIQYVAIVAFGEGPRILQLPAFLGNVIHVGSIRLPVLELVTIGTSAVVVLVFYGLLELTRFGAQIRASAELPAVARLMGVSPDRVLALVFAISGAIAGVCGLLWFAKAGAITPRSDLDPTIKAFIALVLGGLGSTRGAVIGGVALGALEVGMSALLPSGALGYQPAIVFALVVGILIVRPGGLSGSALEVGR
jgi:branched-chain amino acid transport system permease protein